MTPEQLKGTAWRAEETARGLVQTVADLCDVVRGLEEECERLRLIEEAARTLLTALDACWGIREATERLREAAGDA
jgi:hypothetical protein